MKPACSPLPLTILAFALLASTGATVHAAVPRNDPWPGLVSHVADGDTIRVRPLQGGKPVRVRINGIDAPEICQAGGPAARDALKRRVLGRQVVVIGRSRDDYGRLLGQVVLDGDDVGAWMVVQGQAWSYRYRGAAGPYAVQQRRAQASRRGIFSDGHVSAIYPAVFRQQHGTCAH